MKVTVTQEDRVLYEQDGLWGGWTDFSPTMQESTILLNVKEAIQKSLVEVETKLAEINAREVKKSDAG